MQAEAAVQVLPLFFELYASAEAGDDGEIPDGGKSRDARSSAAANFARLVLEILDHCGFSDDERVRFAFALREMCRIDV